MDKVIHTAKDALFEAWWVTKSGNGAEVPPILIQALKDLCREAWDEALRTTRG